MTRSCVRLSSRVNRRAPSARVCTACPVVWSQSSVISFLFRQDYLGAVPRGADPQAPLWTARAK